MCTLLTWQRPWKCIGVHIVKCTACFGRNIFRSQTNIINALGGSKHLYRYLHYLIAKTHNKQIFKRITRGLSMKGDMNLGMLFVAKWYVRDMDHINDLLSCLWSYACHDNLLLGCVLTEANASARAEARYYSSKHSQVWTKLSARDPASGWSRYMFKIISSPDEQTF